MGLAYLISGDVDKITDESKWDNYKDKLQKFELECFHEAIKSLSAKGAMNSFTILNKTTQKLF